MNNTSTPIRLSTPRGGRGEVFTKLTQVPGIQVMQFSALACVRHRSSELVSMQRQGRLSFLLLEEVDVVTGDYLNKIEQAVEEIVQERQATGVVLLTGCQTALLSTDYRLLEQELSQQTGVPVRVHDGCRLCGMDESGPEISGVDGLLYDFLLPSQPSREPTVHLIGDSLPSQDSQVMRLLEQAGVKRLLRLADCTTWEDYQQLSQAHVNLLLSPNHKGIAARLEERLGIPYVCLGGVYSLQELEADFRKLGQLLGIEPNVSQWKEPVERRLAQVKKQIGQRPIAIEGDPELAKWLLQEGFQVTSLTTAFRHGLSQAQKQWFQENAPSLSIHNASPEGRGGQGGPGEAQGRGGQGNTHSDGHGRDGQEHSHGGRGRGEKESAHGGYGRGGQESARGGHGRGGQENAHGGHGRGGQDRTHGGDTDRRGQIGGRPQNEPGRGPGRGGHNESGGPADPLGFAGSMAALERLTAAAGGDRP